MPLLLLIDGHAVVHRAFHALPPLLTSKTGEPTGAVYGFIRMVMKAVQDYTPSHWAIAFDRPTPTFRHAQYEEYKAHRPKTPDELVAQFDRVRQVVDALHIPVFEMDGYEADDVLGTLVRLANSQGVEALVMTGDADTMQLVRPGARVLVPQRNFGDLLVYDEAAVYQKFGVHPGQIPDLKGLKGDPSDNIPGVRGIGDKTATKLINQFDSVEGIYEHIDQVSPQKVRTLLQEGADLAKLSKDLAIIRVDVPLTLDVSRCEVQLGERDKLEGVFRELEFFSLLDKVTEIGRQLGRIEETCEPANVTKEIAYKLVDSQQDLKEAIASLERSSTVAVAISLGGYSNDLSGIALSPGVGSAYYLPLASGMVDEQLDVGSALEAVRSIFENGHIRKVLHDGKRCINVLARYGIEPLNIAFDTVLAAHLLGEKSLDIGTLVLSRLGRQQPIARSSDPKRGIMMDLSPSETAQSMGATVDSIIQLHSVLESDLRQHDLWQLYTEVEMPLVPILARMERNGVAIDTAILRDLSLYLSEQLLILEKDIYEDVGHPFNINSPQQLGEVLFRELGLPGAKKTKTGYSTEASILEGLKQSYPFVGKVLEYRQLTKLKSTYVDALPSMINPETGRIHTTLNQTATATGRLSSSDPNLQNIPIRGELGKQIRHAFIAEPGCLLVGGDYSQIELRILAHLSGDPGLVDAFARDEDIHTATASEVFGVSADNVSPDMRRVAKVVNFGVVYGMSEYGLEQATDLSRAEAAHFIAAYFQKYAGVKKYLEITKVQARDQGYVQTLFGRRRYIPEINSSNRQIREGAERMAINMPVQGTSADIIKLAMIELDAEVRQRKLKSKMILQVHDELLFECPVNEAEGIKNLVADVMSGVARLKVPLKVEPKVGENWGVMK
ncbi:MAG: DNA polymerase I [Chloroflexota bacterium]|nr:DNA polymerase I [Chloroflexota bacterium]